ncbi:MAG: GNAT family N-acetyltransferase [Anaerolineales bacterium]|nr:GNAT family N-acetyltransferase [Anaerolineales bacterium]
MSLNVKRFDESLRSDFFHVHSEKLGCGWCFCVAWWVPSWEGWSERTAEENRKLREVLLESGEYDGYILYDDEQPIGWCQVGTHKRLNKLVSQFSLDHGEDVWAITCFLIAPSYRRRGMANALLEGVLQDLETRGVRTVLAFPKVDPNLDELALWNGPLSLFLRAGFTRFRDDPHRPIFMMDLGKPSD